MSMTETAAVEAVRRMEDHLAQAVARLDEWLSEGHTIRSELALKLHALREADSPEVREAIADAQRRIADNQPYEDAMDVDELVASVPNH